MFVLGETAGEEALERTLDDRAWVTPGLSIALLVGVDEGLRVIGEDLEERVLPRSSGTVHLGRGRIHLEA